MNYLWRVLNRPRIDPRMFNQDGIDISDLLGGIFGRGGRAVRAARSRSEDTTSRRA